MRILYPYIYSMVPQNAQRNTHHSTQSATTMTQKTSAQWTDEQWDKLETYLIEFGQVQTQNDYLYNLQLEFLSGYIGSDIPTIKDNLADLVKNKSIYSQEEYNWESSKTKLMNEVSNIILSLDLQPLVDFTKEKETETTEHQQETPEPNEPIVAIPKTRQSVPKVEIKSKSPPMAEPELPKRELPRLSQTERRMSLDLMQSRPTLLPQHLANLGSHRRASSLSKPALATTSNVNVLAKADISAKPQPQKLNLNSMMQKRDNVGATTTNVEGSPTINKRSRRVSLVGENLPMYIRNQLNLADGGKKLSKKQSRLHNILANSESLYAHSKNTSSSHSELGTVSGAGTSELYSGDYNSNNSDDEEDDKEYISPNSLTKYYELEDQGEVDEGDIDFVDVNGSFERISGGGEEGEEEEEQEELEGDDDYLFRI